jgi:hypothetical protein
MSSKSLPRINTPTLIAQLSHEFAMFRQSAEIQSQQRSEQINKLESTITTEHRAVSRQFESVNQHLSALMVADGKLRSDLEQFVLRHDAPRLLVRLETVETKVTSLERRNDKLDGAALAAKGLWFLVGGLIVGLLVAWLK